MVKTYGEVYLAARRRLKAAGVDSYDFEAKLLASFAAGKTKEAFFRDLRMFPPEGAFERELDTLLERRISGEPVQYIVGEWEFYGLPIKISKDVLIPRDDTEVLAHEAIAILTRGSEKSRALDLCAGSGCIGLAIAANVPRVSVVLGEKYAEALALCETNTRLNRLSRRVSVRELDVFEAPPMLLGSFDLLSANPPYIPTDEILTIDRSVFGYEPLTALDGGKDGLRFFRSIISKWRTVIKPGGHIALECGTGQAEYVCKMLKNAGFSDVETRYDTQNIERVVRGRKPA
jgi:release factor glutamine methyltransferase